MKLHCSSHNCCIITHLLVINWRVWLVVSSHPCFSSPCSLDLISDGPSSYCQVNIRTTLPSPQPTPILATSEVGGARQPHARHWEIPPDAGAADLPAGIRAGTVLCLAPSHQHHLPARRSQPSLTTLRRTHSSSKCFQFLVPDRGIVLELQGFI